MRRIHTTVVGRTSFASRDRTALAAMSTVERVGVKEFILCIGRPLALIVLFVVKRQLGWLSRHARSDWYGRVSFLRGASVAHSEGF